MRRILGAAARVSLVAALALTAAVAGANAPETSPRPKMRAAEEAPKLLRPKARPPVNRVAAVDPLGGIAAPFQSLRPQQRPSAIRRAAALRAAGGICGQTDIQGEAIAPIKGKITGCGVADPVRVRAVSGVGLSVPSVMDCGTARALRRWVAEGVKPAVGSQGGGVKDLRVVAHYACRTRNNRAGAKISEHGKGRAVDVAGIRLQDGSEISVLKDWGQGEKGRALRTIWRAACGPFGTVLGPDSDPFHRDHFHMDTARYRSGSYCR